MKFRTNIPLAQLKPHPRNPRLDLGDLTELIASIKEHGVLQNITVMPEEVNGEWTGDYIILIGHRRCAAAKEAGLTEVPCLVNDELDEREQVATMVIENDQRAALSPYEQAKGYQMMLDLGMSVKEISEKVGASERKVRRRIKLGEFDDEVLKAASDKAITFDELEKLSAIKNETTRNEVLNAFGTSEYGWKYSDALRREHDEEKGAHFREKLLEAGAKEGAYGGTLKHNCIGVIYGFDGTPSDLTDKMIDGIEYFFTIGVGAVYLFTEKVQLEVEENEESREKREKEERIEKNMRELDELCKTAYKLRTGFIAGCNERTCKEHVNDIISFITKVLWSNGAYTGSYWVKNMYPYVGGESKDAKTAVNEFSEFYARTWPHQTLLWNACAMLNDSEDEDFYNGACEYERNEKMISLYDLLCKLGYEMSDVEKKLVNGTHELFEKKEKK